MKQIIQSLIITLLVGGALGTSIGLAFDTSILRMTLLCIVSQFIFFAIYNNYTNRRSKLIMEQEMTKRIDAISKQRVRVPCANCKEQNEYIITYDQDNQFKCEECGTNNSVYINITTAQKTTPVRSETLQIKTLIQNELDARARL